MNSQINDFLKNKYLEVMLENTIYGIDILSIVEILKFREINYVHGQPDYIEGSIVFRKKVISVFDLRKRFSLEAKKPDSNTCIIAINVQDKYVGFIVDSVANIVEIKPDAIIEIEEFNVKINNKFIKGVSLNERQVVILNSQKILNYSEISEI